MKLTIMPITMFGKLPRNIIQRRKEEIEHDIPLLKPISLRRWKTHPATANLLELAEATADLQFILTLDSTVWLVCS